MLRRMSNELEASVCGFAVVTISATRTTENDQSGGIARDTLQAAGHRLIHQRWLGNDLSTVRYQLRQWVDDPRVQVIVAIGGTGIDSNDITYEALAPLITKNMPGFGELLRRLAFEELGTMALETRATGAVCHSTLLFMVPGLPAAVSIAMNRLIVPMLREFVPSVRFSAPVPTGTPR